MPETFVHSITGETVTIFSPCEQRTMMSEVIATFPTTFGLRAYPGEVFRISECDSYYRDSTAKALILYTERKWPDGNWHSFAKGTESELRNQLVSL